MTSQRKVKLETSQQDPLNILNSTKYVVENALDVFLHEAKIDEVISNTILERFNRGLDSEYELGINSTGKIEDDLQLSFVENAVNFCFWPKKGEPKWEVEWPIGEKAKGGWHGLVRCFKRAKAQGEPILDANYLSELTAEEARKLFQGVNNVEIPLLAERVANLREAGKILLQKFDGKVVNLIEASDYDAVKIVKSILENFPSFRDISYLDNKEVIFLKRPQICPNDFAYVLKNSKNKISNLDKLTVYADYKLPQFFRMHKVINYSESLSQKVDSMSEFDHDSREEIEIRAATIWAVELLRQRIGKMTAGEIDNTIWILSQELPSDAKPYHRTRTIFY